MLQHRLPLLTRDKNIPATTTTTHAFACTTKTTPTHPNSSMVLSRDNILVPQTMYASGGTHAIILTATLVASLHKQLQTRGLFDCGEFRNPVLKDKHKQLSLCHLQLPGESLCPQHCTTLRRRCWTLAARPALPEKKRPAFQVKNSPPLRTNIKQFLAILSGTEL